MNIYEARWNNAKKMGEKIKNYIKKGYLVFNDNGSKVGNIIITPEHVSYTLNFEDQSVQFILYLNDNYMDNGSQDTIKEWNNQFRDWTIVHPKNIEKLV